MFRKQHIKHISRQTFFNSIFFSILLFVLVMTSFSVIILHSTYESYNLVKDDVVSSKQQTIADIRSGFRSKVQNETMFLISVAQAVDSMMKSGADYSSIQNYLKQISTFKITSSNPAGVYGYVNGRYVSGAGRTASTAYDPRNRSWYYTAINNSSSIPGDIGSVVQVPPYQDIFTGFLTSSLSVVLSDHKSVLSIDLPVSDIQRLVNNLSIHSQCTGFVVHKNGYIGARINPLNKEINRKSLELKILELRDSENREIDSLADLLHDDEFTKILNFTQNISGEGVYDFPEENGRITLTSSRIHNDWNIVLIEDSAFIRMRLHKILFGNIAFALFTLIFVGYFCFSSFVYKQKTLRYAQALKTNSLLLEGKVREQDSKIRFQEGELTSIQDSVIEGIASLIESRDENTGEHVQNTKFYSLLIANFLLEHKIYPEEVTPHFIELMGNAAVLHDVGKIMISDLILNKPGKLTPSEYEIMKTHAEIGGRIVKDILGTHVSKDQVKMTSEVAHWHHEQWDGNGYPDGLKGKEIPLSARILAVADVFDALISTRVYKDPFPKEYVFSIMEQESGKHFDPELVKVFMELRPQIEKYIENR